ncbi:sodium:proton antiporter [Candidimonas humi]|uniref:Cation:proton antiporter n=1 Tax=Candidimonas humi TaxID=683355 RepID=A0ABV8P1X4_9BURK|nr:sodium:proton antiporter [Candidimonas humi]MBV6306985.1 sodium:proton antiporter [Candidimonas humi]
MTEHHIVVLAGIGIVGVLCQWAAWRVHLPAILFLLIAGLLLGPVAGWLHPDALFGNLLFPFISLSVAVILFEGSLTLQLHEIRGLERVVRRLVGAGMMITWLVTTLAAHWIMRFPWRLSFLFGAITVVTGPTVIAPLLRTVRPVARVANTLRWEGIVIDPLGALLAVLTYEFIASIQGGMVWGHTLLTFGEIVIIGAGMGLVAGIALGEVLRRNWLADYLVNVTVLAVVFAVFALSNAMHSESGLLSVTIMGIWMANQPDLPVDEILEFKETLSLMLLSALFIILAARMDLGSLLQLGWRGPAVLAAMLFVARPLKVAFATWGSGLPWRERALLAWIAPRGIVAAAVSALFAIRLQHLGLPHADQLLPLTFVVIIGTVVLQSATARAMAVALRVAEPDPVGFLIVGANPVALAIGLALQTEGVPVRLCSSDWDAIARARMQGLPTYYGSPVSEHAQRNLDLSGLGSMLALGPRDDFNALVTTRYRDEFGKNRVYVLPSSRRDDVARKHKVASPHRGRSLFAEDATYWKLASLLGQGGAIRATSLTEAFGFEQYCESYGGRLMPLFALSPKGLAEPYTTERRPDVEAGWTVLSLFPPDVESSRSAARSEIEKPGREGRVPA